MNTTPPVLTFAALAQLEPRLQHLRDEAIRHPVDSGYCWQTAWPCYKARLTNLVGWHAPATAPAELKSETAYETAYNEILRALPLCSGLACYCEGPPPPLEDADDE